MRGFQQAGERIGQRTEDDFGLTRVTAAVLPPDYDNRRIVAERREVGGKLPNVLPAGQNAFLGVR